MSVIWPKKSGVFFFFNVRREKEAGVVSVGADGFVTMIEKTISMRPEVFGEEF
jgi:hypothetical protein